MEEALFRKRLMLGKVALIHFIRFLQTEEQEEKIFRRVAISVICHRFDPTKWKAYLLKLE